MLQIRFFAKETEWYVQEYVQDREAGAAAARVASSTHGGVPASRRHSGSLLA
jgi:hypothetical protein